LKYLHAVDVNLGLDAIALFTADNNGDVGADQYEVVELQTCSYNSQVCTLSHRIINK